MTELKTSYYLVTSPPSRHSTKHASRVCDAGVNNLLCQSCKGTIRFASGALYDVQTRSCLTMHLLECSPVVKRRMTYIIGDSIHKQDTFL